MKPLPKTYLCAAIACALISLGCNKIFPDLSPYPGSYAASISPLHGPDSTRVTIHGGGFNDSAGFDAVYFNGRQATIVSATDTSIVVIVPTLCGSGNVSVMVNGKTPKGPALSFGYDTSYRVTKVIDSLSGPFYIAQSTDSNLYIADYGDGKLLRISPQGAPSTALSNYVSGVTIDRFNNIYAAANHGPVTTIVKIAPGGATTNFASDSGYITGMGLDTAGNLYVGNTDHNRVDKITPSGVVSIVDTGLFSVSGVAVAPNGTVYAMNYNVNAYNNAAGVITKISPAGDTATFAHIQYGGWGGLTFDNNNNLCVGNFDQQYAIGSIIRFAPNGAGTKLLSANVPFPVGIVSAGYNFYVVEQADAPGNPYGSVVKLTMH